MATLSSILAWRIVWSLMGYSPWCRKESDMTEILTSTLFTSLIHHSFLLASFLHPCLLTRRWALQRKGSYLFISVSPTPWHLLGEWMHNRSSGSPVVRGQAQRGDVPFHGSRVGSCVPFWPVLRLRLGSLLPAHQEGLFLLSLETPSSPPLS